MSLSSESVLPRFTVGEWTLTCNSLQNNAFDNATLDVHVTEPNNRTLIVPAFFEGQGVWKFRLSCNTLGTAHFKTVCSDVSDSGLHNIRGVFHVVEASKGNNPLLCHGPVQIAREGNYLSHQDGTPYFLLADSWWHAMTNRLHYPDEFCYLVDYRRKQGYNSLQFAVDNPCDVGAFDPRAANEAGHGWTKNFESINPAYWRHTDERIFHLIDSGMLPIIMASWGYYLEFMGEEKMHQHWRYVVARYGALPVMWLLCGEVRLPWYPILKAGGNGIEQTRQWTEIARYVQKINAYQRPLGLHPGPAIWGDTGSYPPLTDMSVIDTYFGMGGHGGFNEYTDATNCLTEMQEYRDHYRKPTLVGECLWGGMGSGCGSKTQRMLFWGSILTGAPGHCYGCDSLWQMNRRDEPFGNTATMERAWGNAPWEESHKWPGAEQIAVGKRILEQFEWWRLIPSNEHVDPHIRHSDGTGLHAACAEIPETCYLIYLAKSGVASVKLEKFTPRQHFHGEWINPIDGSKFPVQKTLIVDADGCLKQPTPPISQDWLLVLNLKK